MGFEFRLCECVVLLLLIPCIFPVNSANKQQTRKKFQSMEGILPFILNKGRPILHDRLLDWNFTNQLSVARYMMTLYKNLNTEDNSRGFQVNISNVTTTKPIQKVDTIMGIQNDATDNNAKRSSFHMTLKFNFTAKIQSGESVEGAEFHIYKDAPNYSWMKNASFLVTLSAITIPGNPNPNLVKKLPNRVMQGDETGWKVFDVTETADKWIISPENNYGLEVSVTLIRKDFPIPVDPTKFGFVGFKGPYDERPFIVSFFNGDPTEKVVKIHASGRKKRSLFKPGNLKYGNTASSMECKKRHLYVDFHELSWQNWIIAPDGYESSYCAGECNYAMYTSRNATNHAIVQTLVNLLNPDSAPAPCCAPTKLNAISVLYYDDKKNVVLKKFQDMVVQSCGCH